MREFSGVFRNKKVFLTGHTGFKGSWMSVWLQMLGAEVRGYSLKQKNESLFRMIKPELAMKSITADIRDGNRLEMEILKFQPDFIFHLAAQSLVRESYLAPAETFETNVMGTANVLDALRFLEKECVCVLVTTDKVYENLEKDYAYNESDKLGGYDPYSASKAACEIVIESYRLSFFNPADFNHHRKSVASARAGNVIGGGDHATDRILPDIFRALSKSKEIVVRNPSAVRPWQHVLEPLSGYLSLAASMKNESNKLATSFNFGPALNDTMTVEALVRYAIKCWGEGNYVVSKSMSEPHEAGILKLDIGKAKRLLGWEPRWDSEQAIEKAVRWYKESLNKKQSIIKLCIADINDYNSKRN